MDKKSNTKFIKKLFDKKVLKMDSLTEYFMNKTLEVKNGNK